MVKIFHWWDTMLMQPGLEILKAPRMEHRPNDSYLSRLRSKIESKRRANISCIRSLYTKLDRAFMGKLETEMSKNLHNFFFSGEEKLTHFPDFRGRIIQARVESFTKKEFSMTKVRIMKPRQPKVLYIGT